MNLGDSHRTLVPGAPAPIFLPPITFRTDYQLVWLSTVRGRIGVPFGRVLVYGTGGLAIGELSIASTVPVAKRGGAGRPLVGSTESHVSGWTAWRGGRRQ